MSIKWSCFKCRLSSTCRQPILHGDGDSHPDVLVVGDMPNKFDDERGTPFVSKTGEFLRNLIDRIGEGRTVRYTNAIRCYDAKHKPTPTEVKLCRNYLISEIRTTKPKCILLLGATAVHGLLGNDVSFNQVRGKRLFWKGIPFISTYHPSFIEALMQSKGKKKIVKDAEAAKKQWRDDLFLAFSEKATEFKSPPIDIVDVDEFCSTVRSWKDEEYVAFDIESTGLNPYALDARVLCISASNGEETIVVKIDDNDDLTRVTLALSRCHLIAHNAKFDVKYLRVLTGINLFPKVVGCTYLEAYAFDERQQLNLKSLTSKNHPEYSGFESEMYEHGAYGDGGFIDVPLDVLMKYNGVDSFVCWLEHKLYMKKLTLKQKEYVCNVLLDGSEMLVDVECNGFNVYRKRMMRTTVKVAHDRLQLEKKIKGRREYEKFVRKFEREPNLNSPNDKIQLLYTIPQITPTHKTKGGAPSTAKDHLEEIGTPIAKLCCELSSVNKVQTTYAGSAALNWIQPDGLVHSTFGFNADNGRLSSEKPNLQNQLNPKKGHAYNTRAYFISRFGNGEIISADYKAVELRMFAQITQAKFFIDIFRQGRDPHAEMASQIYGVSLGDVTAEQRENGKTCNFEFLYESSAYGMVQEHGKTERYWEKMIREWLKVVKEVVDYRAAIRSDVINKGFVESVFGARRNFDWQPSLSTAEKDSILREAGNHPISNAATNVTTSAAIELNRELKKGGYNSCIVNLVHDNIIVDGDIEHEPDVPLLVKSTMEDMDFDWLKIDIPVDLTISPSWGGA